MEEAEVPETHVLAIASHVTSGHVGYKRFKGRKSTPEEVHDLYTGLQSAHLADAFDMLLSGYAPSASVVYEIGRIARELKLRSQTRPGAFFWVLDPVMGDNGHLYVAEDVVPAYKHLLKDADLILPNQFEAEVLSDMKIHDLATMKQAIASLHETHRVPHVIITSMRLPPSTTSGVNTPTTTTTTTQATDEEDLASTGKLSIVGSTATSDMTPRLFRITVPALPVYFSGTGDMFASLMVARLRQAAQAAGVLQEPSWRSPDNVTEGADLPLAKAAEKVLASMHAVLKDTARRYDEEAKKMQEEKGSGGNEGVGDEAGEDREMQAHLRLTRAAEVRVVRNSKALREPPDLGVFRAQSIPMEPTEVGVAEDEAAVKTEGRGAGEGESGGGQAAIEDS